MNWLIKAIEKLTRPLVVVLKKTKNPRRVVLGLNLTAVGVFLGAALVGLVPLGTVLGALVGGCRFGALQATGAGTSPGGGPRARDGPGEKREKWTKTDFAPWDVAQKRTPHHLSA